MLFFIFYSRSLFYLSFVLLVQFAYFIANLRYKYEAKTIMNALDSWPTYKSNFPKIDVNSLASTIGPEHLHGFLAFIFF